MRLKCDNVYRNEIEGWVLRKAHDAVFALATLRSDHAFMAFADASPTANTRMRCRTSQQVDSINSKAKGIQDRERMLLTLSLPHV